MTIKQISDAQALALSGTVDADTGLAMPNLNQSFWAQAIYRALDQFANVAAADLKVCEVEENTDDVAVLPGRCAIAGVAYSFAGADPAVENLAASDVTYIWAEDDGSGALQIASAVDATGWPVYPHFKLAEVTTATGGAVSSILDRRKDNALFAALGRHPGVITVTAPTGGYSQWDVVDLSSRIAVCLRAITAATTGPAAVEGIFTLAADSGTGKAFAQGEDLYWDGSKLVTASTGNTPAGWAAEAKPAMTATCAIKLPG